MHRYTIVLLTNLLMLCSVSVALSQQSSSHNIEWSTFFAPNSKFNSNDPARMDISVDHQGNVIMLAEIEGEPFQASSGAFQPHNAGGRDMVLAKFSPQGALLWATYYGGSNDEKLYIGGHGPFWNQLAIDRNNNIYITGWTASTNFPVSKGFLPKDTNDGGSFLIKFDPKGERLWSQVYKDRASFLPVSLVVDRQGSPIIIGRHGIDTMDLPTVFLAKFDTNGGFVWKNTYGEGQEIGLHDAAVDSTDAVIFTGFTTFITKYPLEMTPGTIQPNYGGGGTDALVVKFDADGQLVWGTYYGGSSAGNSPGTDYGFSIAVAPNNDVVVAGRTTSYDVTGMNSESLQPNNNHFGGGVNAFLLRLTPEGGHVWSTYFGGMYEESCLSMAIDHSGKIAMVLQNTSPDIVLVDPLPYPRAGNGRGGMMYIAEFSGDGKQLLWGTCFGPDYTWGSDIDYSPQGDIILAGFAFSDTFPTTRGAYQEKLNGEVAYFITKFGCTIDPPVVSPQAQTVCYADSAVLTAPAGYAQYLWQPGGATTSTLTVGTGGVYRVYVTDEKGCSGISEPATVTFLPKPQARIVADKLVACAGESIRLEVKKDKSASCVWSTGETSASITVFDSGTYRVEVYQEQSTGMVCTALDSVTVVVRTASDLVVEPSVVDFVSDACQESVEREIQVQNTRQDYVDVTDVTVTGSTEFEVLSPVGAVRLLPGESMTMRIRYQPASPSTSGSVEFRSIPCDIIHQISLVGNASLLAGPEDVDMGRRFLCEPLRDTVVYIENRGVVAISLERVEADAPFSIITSVTTIAPGERAALRINFTPPVAGEYNGSFRVVYRSGTCEDELTGTLHSIAEDVDVIVQPTVDFDPLLCAAAPVHLKIPVAVIAGSEGVEVRRVKVDAPFAVDLTAGASLSAGDHELDVVFTPSAPGEFSGVAEIEFSPCGIKRRIELRGEYRTISYTATDPVDFGVVRPGLQQERDVVFTNTSDVVLHINSLDCFSTPYELVSPSPLSLPIEVPPGKGVVFRVRFAPQQEGEYRDSICISGMPCGFSTNSILTGRCSGVQGRSVVQAPSLDCSPGEHISLGLSLVSEEKLQLSGARRFRCRVSVDELLFDPERVSTGTYIESHQSGRVLIDMEVDCGRTPAVGETLVVLEGLVLYGSSRETPVAIETFEWLDADVVEEQIDGRLNVDICFPTGFNLLSVPRIKVDSYHSGSEALEVEVVDINRPGELEIWSVSGEKMYSRRIEQPGSVSITTDALGSGVYQVVLTEQRLECRQVVLIVR